MTVQLSSKQRLQWELWAELGGWSQLEPKQMPFLQSLCILTASRGAEWSWQEGADRKAGGGVQGYLHKPMYLFNCFDLDAQFLEPAQ